MARLLVASSTFEPGGALFLFGSSLPAKPLVRYSEISQVRVMGRVQAISGRPSLSGWNESYKRPVQRESKA